MQATDDLVRAEHVQAAMRALQTPDATAFDGATELAEAIGVLAKNLAGELALAGLPADASLHIANLAVCFAAIAHQSTRLAFLSGFDDPE